MVAEEEGKGGGGGDTPRGRGRSGSRGGRAGLWWESSQRWEGGVVGSRPGLVLLPRLGQVRWAAGYR